MLSSSKQNKNKTDDAALELQYILRLSVKPKIEILYLFYKPPFLTYWTNINNYLQNVKMNQKINSMENENAVHKY